ncbi:LysR family transcriptional regulator [Bordetella petrii]|uniref:LysR family transcriptional regulator n=1 Tax=Bordetella petrii TaxID=94624 RepID=UPI001E5EB22B|nr:LysR family transcriptional regulator [Bordetella petrii]MCD0504398.1 LysR family transcriptional regulator [Bordetella petrii]
MKHTVDLAVALINRAKKHILLSMNTSIDLPEMRVFAAVVTDGSFTAAAERLGTDKARVSRIVRRMEEKLGARLLARSTRRLSVTEVGRDYFERAVCILTAAEAAEAAVAQQSREPKGLLKITAGSEFGTMVVDEWIAAFLRRAPKVTVEAEYTNRLVDIIHEGFDVAVRVGTLEDSGLSARRLGEVAYGLYAAPDYLRRGPALVATSDLKHHDLIMKATRGRSSWALVNGAKTEKVAASPRCAVNSTIAAKNLALAGLGIAQLPRFMAESHVRDGSLIRVLSGWAEAPAPVHAVFASSRYMDPKVRSFVDLSLDAFKSATTDRRVPNRRPSPG